MRSHNVGALICSSWIRSLFNHGSIACCLFDFSTNRNRKLFATFNEYMKRMRLGDRGFINRVVFDSHYSSSPGYDDPALLLDEYRINLTVKGMGVVVTLSEVRARQQYLVGRTTRILKVAATEGLEEWSNKNCVVKISFSSKPRFSNTELVESLHSKAEKTGDYRILNHFPSFFHRGDSVLGNDHLERYLKNCKWADNSHNAIEDGSRVSRIAIAERLYPGVKSTLMSSKVCVTSWNVKFDIDGTTNIAVHHWIYESAHILHRDVSLRSIMFRRRGRGVYGVLIDFDLSSIRGCSRQYFSQGTGTFPFWARDLHEAKSPKHLYRHDLESFFYVFLFVVCSYKIVEEGNKVRLRRDSREGMMRWLAPKKHRDTRWKKFKILCNNSHFLEIAKERHDDFEVAIECLKILRRGFRRGLSCEQSGGETLGGNVTYDLFMKARSKIPFPLS